MRVYETFIKGCAHIATSFVPKGRAADVLAGSVLGYVVEEKIIQGAEQEVDPSIVATYERTASSFDRTIELPYGAPAIVRVPDVWEAQLENGLRVYGIENGELPLVQFELTLRGGQLLDAPDKVGVANLVAMVMNRGTATKTPAELEVAIEELGATISIGAGREEISVSGSTLARNYAATVALVTEMLLEPRWDAKEFELSKLSAVNDINAQLSSPNAIAENVYRLLIYGDDHILSRNILGTEETIASITLDDLRRFYAANFSSGLANLHVAGAVSHDEVLAALGALEAGWVNREVHIPEYEMPSMPDAARIYFYDVPGAKQSVLRFGYPALTATDADYYPARIMNYILGAGGFASRLMQELREGKGYTYGIGSSFSGTTIPGPFTVSSGVRSNVTYEASQLIKNILEQYGATFTEADLDVTKNFLLKSKARSFETLGAKLLMLQFISAYDWPYDYVKEQDRIIDAMTVARVAELAAQYIRPERMIYLVVGDAETQYERLKQLGLGDPLRLN